MTKKQLIEEMREKINERNYNKYMYGKRRS